MEMTYTETLIVVHCWCGIPVAIPENRYDWMKKAPGNNCYCPVGHSFVFNNTLKEQLDAERANNQRLRERITAERDLREAEERSHAATRGHLTRVKKRVHNGVCPHCNRSFQDLRRHMRSKHRDEMKEPGQVRS